MVREADVECVTELVVHARITPLLCAGDRRFFEEYIKNSMRIN